MAEVTDIVESVLSKQYKSTEVYTAIDLEIDIGNLLSVDNNVVDLKSYRQNRDEYIKELTRDNVQVLMNRIWELPVERNEEAIVAKLPRCHVITPREKPLPKARAPTRWEEYAKAKGIQNRKKSKLVWDDVLKKWKPRWGYGHSKAEQEKDWMIEVPDNADPYEDQFAKKNENKAERVAKNELQRLRNFARSKKIKVPGVGVTPTEQPSKEQVGIAAKLAKLATASVGKFTDALPLDKPVPKLGKKRKFEPMFGDLAKERSKNLDILKKITNKNPKMNIEKAISKTSSMESQKIQKNQKKSKTQLKKKQGKGNRRHLQKNRDRKKQ